MIKRVFIILGLLLLAGCASRPQSSVQPTPPPNPQQVATAEVKLAEAAVSVSHSLQQLAALEKARTPGVSLPPPPNPDRTHMAQITSVNWSGPLQPIIRKLALALNFRLNILGHPPVVPIVITITAKNTPLAYILRDINFQAEKKANIIVYPNRKIIELRYL